MKSKLNVSYLVLQHATEFYLLTKSEVKSDTLRRQWTMY